MEKKPSNKKICDYCGIDASCLCFECSEYFCDSCFKCIHEKQLRSKHKKEDIDPYIPFDLKCRNHPNIPNNLFCTDEKSNSFIYILIINYFYSSLLFLLLL